MKRFLKNGITVMAGALAGMLSAEAPDWWLSRGILNTNSVPNDFAPVNQGQLKHMTHMAYNEFLFAFPSSDLSVISNLVDGFTSTNNYQPVNLGQLKAAVAPFYDMLQQSGRTDLWPEEMVSGPYPWSSSGNSANDYAIANLGQLKYLFSFNVLNIPHDLDSDNDGMPDWWEIAMGLDPYRDDSAEDPDGDGVSNLEEYLAGTHPNIKDGTLPAGVSGRQIFEYDEDGRLQKTHLIGRSSEILSTDGAHNIDRENIYNTNF